jgi:hypothetical protein
MKLLSKIKSIFIQRVEIFSGRKPFYGIAWVDYPCNYLVLMPMPLNVIAGALRRLYFALMNGIRPHEIERLRRQLTLNHDVIKRYQAKRNKHYDLAYRIIETRLLSNPSFLRIGNIAVFAQQVADEMKELLNDETPIHPPQ